MICTLIVIAGTIINPCTIASMRTAGDDCVIFHNSGDAWSGQHKTYVDNVTCEFITRMIQEKQK